MLGNAANRRNHESAHLDCARWPVDHPNNGYEAGRSCRLNLREKSPDIEIIARAHYDDEVKIYCTERGANQVVMGEARMPGDAGTA